jgi:hydroxymethylpyrimidine/phosphomethylpyrimidine kinase
MRRGAPFASGRTGARTLGLDLDEHQCVPVEDDEVQLTEAPMVVAGQRLKAERPQMSERQILAAPTKRAARIDAPPSLSGGCDSAVSGARNGSALAAAVRARPRGSPFLEAREAPAVDVLKRSRVAGGHESQATMPLTPQESCLCQYCSGTVTSSAHTPRVLTIAGSDSGGGAGIQADLKAFAYCGVHGMCAITAITAQNTLGVSAIHPIPPEIVLAQVRAVIADIGVDAVKVGMLGTAEVTHAVAQALDELPAGTPVVVDPVMVAESGSRLLERDAQHALISEIVPRASVLTPNLPEALELAGREAEAQPGAHSLIHDVLALGPGAVVLTGGHRPEAVDLFIAAGERQVVEIAAERHPDGAAHGSGCTHSSVLAAQLALGRTPLQAARVARALAGMAVAQGLRDVGEGPGPVDIFGRERRRLIHPVGEHGVCHNR